MKKKNFKWWIALPTVIATLPLIAAACGNTKGKEMEKDKDQMGENKKPNDMMKKPDGSMGKNENKPDDMMKKPDGGMGKNDMNENKPDDMTKKPDSDNQEQGNMGEKKPDKNEMKPEILTPEQKIKQYHKDLLYFNLYYLTEFIIQNPMTFKIVLPDYPYFEELNFNINEIPKYDNKNNNLVSKGKELVSDIEKIKIKHNNNDLENLTPLIIGLKGDDGKHRMFLNTIKEEYGNFIKNIKEKDKSELIIFKKMLEKIKELIKEEKVDFDYKNEIGLFILIGSITNIENSNNILTISSILNNSIDKMKALTEEQIQEIEAILNVITI
ncbi:hypothetical protein DA803_01715 [[Mycoplasma] phocae]|uniref:Lipoprotein n=1 Tax=[Mycoplasma] phocae TaxID=142651 RepID=A0A2Z5IR11_9BACT|nr:hypothetical protein [[Mycoplasma] phocae]AXE60801.1 hypothetical protein DA803_01715 [[Mycoplasma] phocae]